MNENPLEVVLPIALSFFAFLIILTTVILFIYFARKKMFAKEMELANMKLESQRNHISSMIQVQEAERTRISRDLHDAFNSQLSVISFNLQHLKRISKDESVQEICNTTLLTNSSLIENARRISHNLIPVELEHVSLLESIKKLCSDFGTKEGLEVVFMDLGAESILRQIQPEYKIHVYRIIQELLVNSVKHGNATRIELKVVGFEPNDIEFAYQDDGNGFDTKHESKSAGIGMQNIFYRTEIIGGRSEFTSSPNNGFSFKLYLKKSADND